MEQKQVADEIADIISSAPFGQELDEVCPLYCSNLSTHCSPISFRMNSKTSWPSWSRKPSTNVCTAQIMFHCISPKSTKKLVSVLWPQLPSILIFRPQPEHPQLSKTTKRHSSSSYRQSWPCRRRVSTTLTISPLSGISNKHALYLILVV